MVKKTKIPKEISEYFSKCGRASSAKMTPEERKERARKAAMQRWKPAKPSKP